MKGTNQTSHIISICVCQRARACQESKGASNSKRERETEIERLQVRVYARESGRLCG